MRFWQIKKISMSFRNVITYSFFCDILTEKDDIRGLNMKDKKYWLLRLVILLFSVSVSATVLPYSIVNTFGLFGEVTSATVTDDKESEIVEESHTYEAVKQVKGINIYNIWFEVWIWIICLIFIVYMLRLPRGYTIVSLKVRMDD